MKASVVLRLCVAPELALTVVAIASSAFFSNALKKPEAPLPPASPAPGGGENR